MNLIKRIGSIAAAVAVMACCATPAMAQVTLSSDVTADVGEFVPLIAADLSTVVIAVLGVFFAFLLVKFGIKWVRGTTT